MSSASFSPESIRTAADLLRAGGVVAFPTETVYGLGADALDAEAVGRVFGLKGRPPNNPLIVHVADETMARRLARVWPDRAGRLARAFWPGPVTIVVQKSDEVPALVTGGGSTVALRCPDHPAALALLKEFGRPIVGPSANRSGGVSPTTAAHVRTEFDEREVFVVDGGACRVGIESAVVSVAGARPRLLRPGSVGTAEIERALGERVDRGDASVGVALAEAGAPLPGPGMMERHYAPRARARLVEAGEIEAAAAGDVVVIGFERSRPSARGAGAFLEMPASAETYAARLYAALREADARSPALIAIERPTGEGATWDAIRDRLARATTE